MRTYICAEVALDAVCRIPLRYHNRYTALLISCSAAGHMAIFISICECGDRKQIAAFVRNRNNNVFNEFDECRVVAADYFFCRLAICGSPGSRNIDLYDSCCAFVYSIVVHLNNVITL